VARNLFLAMCLTIQEEEREREREREGSLSARGTAGCEHGESINQGSIRRHFILDPRSRRPRLSHTRTSPPLAYPPPQSHPCTPTVYTSFSRSLSLLFLSSPVSVVRSFSLSPALFLRRAILGDLYGQYRGGISTIGRTRVMLVADTTWLLVSK